MTHFISKTFLISIFLFLGLEGAHAQTELKDVKPEAQFDFWLGTWELTWQDADGGEAKGSNHIERILNGKVIKENFEALSGDLKGYIGKSYSVYNARTDTWKQTWVDNGGGYLDFTGITEDGQRIFQRESVNPAGEKVLQRMRFYDIKENSLIWDWEVSTVMAEKAGS